MQRVAERLDEQREVPEIVDPELVAVGDCPKDSMKTRQVRGLLRNDSFALRLVDVLTGLLAHRAEERLSVLRQIHEEGSTRLHINRRAADAPLFERLREGLARGGLRIAGQAPRQAAPERFAKRGDRLGKLVVIDKRTARRVRHVPATAEAFGETLAPADPRVRVFEYVALGAPAGRALHLGPAGGLEEVRAPRLVHQPVPVARLVRGRRPCPHQGQSLCGVFARRRGGSGQLARSEGALGVALAAVEHRTAAAAASDELALATLRAGDAGLLLRLLDVLAVRVAGASDERPEAAAPSRERLAAVRADLALEDLELRLLLSLEWLGVVARAFRERLALLALLEAGARVEAAVPTELDDDRPSALRADAIGGLLGHVRLLDRLRLLLDELAERSEEVANDRDPLDFAVGDLVEVLLHPRGEARVHDVREVLAQEVGDDEADVLRHERAAFLADVLAIDERRDRRRVRRRPADAVLLERFHERRFGEARWRLREVLRCVEAKQLQSLTRLNLGKRGDLLLGLVARLEVHAQEPIEEHAASARAQQVLACLHVETRALETRRCHLRRDRPLPDDRVELQLVGFEVPLHTVRGPRKIRGPDRLVRLLRALRTGLVVARLIDRVGRAEFLRDDLTRLVERALGDVERVGAHIGDETDRGALPDRDAFIELLRQDHRPLHRIAELAGCLLLQGRGGEGRRGVPAALLLLDALDRVLGIGERRTVLVRGLTVMDFELVAFVLDDLRRQRLARVVRERGLERPVLLGHKGLDLALAVDNQPKGDGLNAAGGKPVANLLPEERRHRVADEPVDDASGLLGVDQVLVDVPRVLGGFLDGGRRDLVEGDTAERCLGHLDDVGQMPGDRLTLAVEVRRQPDVVRRLGFAAERPGVLLRVVRHDVLGHERF